MTRTVGRPPFAPVDFGRFHAEDVPVLLEDHAAVVAHRPDELAPLALQVGEAAVTYRIAPDGGEVVEGVARVTTRVGGGPGLWRSSGR